MAVTLLAHAAASAAIHGRSCKDGRNAALVDRCGGIAIDDLARPKKYFSGRGVHDITSQDTAERPPSHGPANVHVRIVADLAAVGGATVILGDHGVLADVDKAPGEVAGVGGSQRRVGQAFARAVGGDEVFENA